MRLDKLLMDFIFAQTPFNHTTSIINLKKKTLNPLISFTKINRKDITNPYLLRDDHLCLFGWLPHKGAIVRLAPAQGSYLTDLLRLGASEAASWEGVITECEVRDALKQVDLNKSSSYGKGLRVRR